MHLRMQRGAHSFYAEVRYVLGLIQQGLARSD